MDTIGARLKYLRKAAGQDQKGFAAAIGISQGTLSDIENGKCRPSAETLIAVCKYCRISSDWILFGAGKDAGMKNADEAAHRTPPALEAEYPSPEEERHYWVKLDGSEKELLDIYREFNQDAQMELRMFIKVKLDYLRMKKAENYRL